MHVVLNSNLIIPDFPHIGPIEFFLLHLCNVRTQQKNLMELILFSYYEESLASSNLNSKLLAYDFCGCENTSMHLIQVLKSLYYVAHIQQMLCKLINQKR
jgi:hypothetical protein